jgi:hypothetical protein
LTLAASGFLVEQPIENQKFHPTDLWLVILPEKILHKWFP